jgi:sugar phosphate isomerase/epimerase
MKRAGNFHMHLGYNTNSFAFHPWPLALELIAEMGYRSVALTIDYSLLNPFDSEFEAELNRVRNTLKKLKLKCVIETGSRYLLDPRSKHQPTLLTENPTERMQRSEFLRQALVIAHELEAEAMSFWSGNLEGIQAGSSTPQCAIIMQRLAQEIQDLLPLAQRYNIPLAFEPEPGMFIATMDEYRQLKSQLDSPLFGLTIDIGHVQCLEDKSITATLKEWAPLLYNVHIEDMKRGVHDHLMFGQGEIDFAPIAQTLRDLNYQKGVYVELSRHSHIAYETAQASWLFLNQHGF